jgi:hypothetical protein
MRHRGKVREIAAGGAPSALHGKAGTSSSPTKLPRAKPFEAGPDSPEDQLASFDRTRPLWVYLPKGLVRQPADKSQQATTTLREEQGSSAHKCLSGPAVAPSREVESTGAGAKLFQDSYFFCKVAGVGDVPGPGRIFVETAVERDSGLAFAKVYSSKTAINAVDLLASRVVPFFEGLGIVIGEIHTRKTREYCGVAPAHPFETFLTTSKIQHLHFDKSDEEYHDLCDRFYTVLLNEFFLPALRKKFRLSLDDLQRDLDVFIQAHNAAYLKRFEQSERSSSP